MSDWVTLTVDDATAELTPQEAAMLKAIAGSDDTAAGIVERVTEEVREAYRSGGRPVDGDGIPAAMQSRAVAIARWRLLTSYPQLAKLQTKDRKDANDAAMKYLDQIATREIRGSGSAQIVSGNARQATRTKLSGL
jgi:hypothetical protein